MHDVGILEVFWNLPYLTEELEQADKLLSECLTTHLEDFGWYSVWARGLASLQLLQNLDVLCFCWRAIEAVNLGTLGHVLNCLEVLFNSWLKCAVHRSRVRAFMDNRWVPLSYHGQPVSIDEIAMDTPSVSNCQYN